MGSPGPESKLWLHAVQGGVSHLRSRGCSSESHPQSAGRGGSRGGGGGRKVLGGALSCKGGVGAALSRRRGISGIGQPSVHLPPLRIRNLRHSSSTPTLPLCLLIPRYSCSTSCSSSQGASRSSSDRLPSPSMEKSGSVVGGVLGVLVVVLIVVVASVGPIQGNCSCIISPPTEGLFEGSCWKTGDCGLDETSVTRLSRPSILASETF